LQEDEQEKLILLNLQEDEQEKLIFIKIAGRGAGETDHY